jgi:NhaP-type Na+/H+ or K+/H+ antiporter
MQKKSRTPFAQMIIHCAMGAILGALLAIALMVANRHIFHFIASSSSPMTEMAFFVGFISFVFAIGATLSGFIFTAIEINALKAKQRTERFNWRRDSGT